MDFHAMLIIPARHHVFVGTTPADLPPRVEIHALGRSSYGDLIRSTSVGEACWSTYRHAIDWTAVVGGSLSIVCGITRSLWRPTGDGWLIASGGVEDFSIRCFAADLLAHEDAFHTLSGDVDGVELRPCFGSAHLPREMIDDGVRMLRFDLPPWVLDGLEHRTTLKNPTRALHSETYQSGLVFHVEEAQPGRFRGWCFDRSQRDLPLSMTLIDGSDRRTSITLTTEPDIEHRWGRSYGGFHFSFDTGSRGPARLAIGRNAQIPLLRLAARAGVPASPEPSPPRRPSASRYDVGIDHPSSTRAGDETGNIVACIPLRPVTAIVTVDDRSSRVDLCLSSLSSLMMSDDVLHRVLIVCDRDRDVRTGALCHDFCSTWGDRALLIAGLPTDDPSQRLDRALKNWDGESDVLVLSAEIALAFRTLRKLRWSLHSAPHIASASPLSNEGTILGYPDDDSGCAMLLDEALKLDDLSEALFRGRVVDIPAPVASCMLVKAESVEAIARFDEASRASPQDEVEWCSRARDSGHRHVAAPDCFAWHWSSGSSRASVRSGASIRPRPALDRSRSGDLGGSGGPPRTNPLGAAKLRLFMATIPDEVSLILHLCHAMGGGTHTYIENLIEVAGRQGYLSLRISLDAEPAHRAGVMICDQTAEIIRFDVDQLAPSLEVLGRRTGRVRIMLHSLVGVHREWIAAVQRSELPVTVMLHDYQWYCPRIFLINRENVYCGEPAPAICDSCVAGSDRPRYPGTPDHIENSVGRWIDLNGAVLRSAHKIIAPSREVAQRYRAKFPMLPIRVLSHQYDKQRARLAVRSRRSGQPLTIAVVGGINVAKGCDWLLAACREVDASAQNIRIVLVGDAQNRREIAECRCFEMTGPYESSRLPETLSRLDPDFVLFPGVWPETFCFVLSEVWRAGLCPVARDVGAIAERIRETGAGVLLDLELSPKAFVANAAKISRRCRDLDGLEFSFGDELDAASYIRALLS